MYEAKNSAAAEVRPGQRTRTRIPSRSSGWLLRFSMTHERHQQDEGDRRR